MCVLFEIFVIAVAVFSFFYIISIVDYGRMVKLETEWYVGCDNNSVWSIFDDVLCIEYGYYTKL